MDLYFSCGAFAAGHGGLMAATLGVPLMPAEGAIPLLQQWLSDGMIMGSAAAFMVTGTANVETK